MKILKLIFLMAIGSVVARSASAQTVTFGSDSGATFGDTGFLVFPFETPIPQELGIGDFSFTAIKDGGMGISGSGIGRIQTDESLVFTFSSTTPAESIFITEIDLGAFDDGDSYTIAVDDTTIISGGTADPLSLGSPIVISDGTTITFTGDDYRVRGFTFAAIPEPSAHALIGGILAFGLLAYRKLKHG